VVVVTNNRQEKKDLQHLLTVESIGILQSNPLDSDEHFFSLRPLSPTILMDHTWQSSHGNNNILHFQLILTSLRKERIH